ncbi:hypothetical protein QO010_001867 [Caulobacter ginsengisoli]|uniref:Uncharacterized protein n=1 Tax=Caulobacter ginsengisoli TaxID=400775 RepID=A0ABU0IQ06_9CAUL|nr:hypothetical protein [Caulobacter ginsengisoli]MDQ0464096.1 hypothetical protein [Caulobacter ginsengisoli]
MNDVANKHIDPLRRLAGWIVVAIGVLWLLLSGACTALALAYALPDALGHATAGELAGLLATILIPGGIGIAIGWGIYAVGRAIAGRRKG